MGPTPTPCGLQFSDVPQTASYYQAVEFLACEGAISGYADGTFHPNSYTTRGQVCKIIVLAEGWHDIVLPRPTFSDVPRDHPFFTYVEIAYNRGIINGYADGTFRPGNNVTRGQLCKIIALAQDWPLLNPPTPTFTDVPTDYPFYTYIETAYAHGIISGYGSTFYQTTTPQEVR